MDAQIHAADLSARAQSARGECWLALLVDGGGGDGRVVGGESVAGTGDGGDCLECDLAESRIAGGERVAECERDRGIARLHGYRLRQGSDRVEAALGVALDEWPTLAEVGTVNLVIATSWVLTPPTWK